MIVKINLEFIKKKVLLVILMLDIHVDLIVLQMDNLFVLEIVMENLVLGLEKL